MMNKDIIIQNGMMHDPVNGISGEKKDIFISKGKIVDRF